MRPPRAAALLLLLLLGGCAAQDLRFHSLPAQTPAADNAAAVRESHRLQAELAALARGAGAPELVTPADAPSMQTYDPWERLNRFTYRFNARFDRAVFLPVANGYGRLPGALRSGVHNFFENLTEIDDVVDYTLQGRLGHGVHSFGRLLINSTIGIGGLFDIARKLSLPAAPTTFSATLATWGVHPGPYLVIPLLGPSTLRDGVGLVGDYGVLYGVNPFDLYRGPASWPLGLTNGVDQRAHVAFRYYSTGSPFEYELVRFLYMRQRLLEDGALRPDARPSKAAAGQPAGQ